MHPFFAEFLNPRSKALAVQRAEGICEGFSLSSFESSCYGSVNVIPVSTWGKQSNTSPGTSQGIYNTRFNWVIVPHNGQNPKISISYFNFVKVKGLTHASFLARITCLCLSMSILLPLPDQPLESLHCRTGSDNPLYIGLLSDRKSY